MEDSYSANTITKQIRKRKIMLEFIKKLAKKEETKREVLLVLFESPRFILASVSAPVRFARACSREVAEMFALRSLLEQQGTSDLFGGIADVRVERLQDVACVDSTMNAGDAFICRFDDPEFVENIGDKKDFQTLWDSTVKDVDIDRFGWDANPWVCVYSFDS